MPDTPRQFDIEVALLGRGFGESVVLHVGSGEYAVIDSLAGEDGVSAPLRYLRDCGASLEKVSIIVATHWHDDHVAGISELYAACRNARLVLPLALSTQEFSAFAGGKAHLGTSRVSSGVRELMELQRIRGAEKRDRPQLVQASTVIMQRLVAGKNVKLTALSPSIEDVGRFLDSVSAPAGPRDIDVRAMPFRPNDISVAIWCELGPITVLLGADLTNLGAVDRGWKAVVASTERPIGRATVFKLPHHGSINAHNDDVWRHMLIASPIAMLAPFNHGRGVPTGSDVARILSMAPEGYSTTVTPFRTPKGDARVSSRVLEADGYSVSSTARETGVVRIRVPIDGSSAPTVTLQSGACHLNRFVAKAA